ncbi:MAG: PASTA domain-containing protein [Candidatus Marinimicrobia bacterium]|jgi:serine/threonine-protein kinase|nr:PASTA domain-containing protein [Candidatus Neomarinimicrobiota bacterium]MDP6852371.1 PASTA domain-containing protein [Candidatus Neomarinimicrobiota bacterium]
MLRTVLKYFTALAFLSAIGIFLLDYFLLPQYVGFDNEHYLPDVRGEYLEKASYQLNMLGFPVENIVVPFSELYKPGTVIKMFPRAFTKVKEGRTIDLTVAGMVEDIQIPHLVNMSLRNAKIVINDMGLGVDTVIYEFDSQVEEGRITFQLPRKGQVVKSSTNITLGVSKGSPPDYYIIPDVVNMSLRKAEEEILKNGLRVGNISFEYQPELLRNTVIEQDKTAGMRVTFPATINILVSTDKKNTQ